MRLVFINPKVNDDAHIVALKLMHVGRTNKSVRCVQLKIQIPTDEESMHEGQDPPVRV